MLKGNLSGFSLGEIFQSLAINRHTGTLAVRLPGADEKLIYFEKGKIVLFSHGKPETPKIGELLLRQDKLTDEQLQAALEAQKSSAKFLGLILFEMGFIDENDIRLAVETKIREELYDLFLVNEGEFEFQMDHLPEELFDTLQKTVQIDISPNSVIMEGLRRLDEWGMIRKTIETFREIYVATGATPDLDDRLLKEVYSLVDGAASVHDICRQVNAARFDTCKALFELLDRKWIRPLKVEELRAEAEKCTKQKLHAEAAAFLRYAGQRSPDEPEIFVRLGDNLAQSHQEKEAEKAYLQALRLYFDQGDWQQAATIAENLPPNADLDIRELTILLRTFIQLKLTKKALWAGNQLAQAYLKEGAPQKAAEVLDSIGDLDPSDLNLKLQIAGLFRGANDDVKATAYYEEVASELEAQKKIKDQIKVLRIVVEINPEREEVKQKIALLQDLQKKLEVRRKRRVTVAGVGLILLFSLCVVPLLYELKARELYAHGQRMEEIAMVSRNFGAAKKIYEEILSDYSFSSRSNDARLAVERLADFERNHLELLKLQQSQQENQIDVKEDLLVKSFMALVQSGKEAEAAGDFRQAHEVFSKALAIKDEHPRTRSTKIRLPLHVTSDPSGAQVEVNGEVKGTTPIVLHYDAEEEWSLRISLFGCEDEQQKLVLTTQYELHHVLPRRPTKSFELLSTFDQPLAASGKNIVFASRDGHVYGFSPGKEDLTWQPVRVGRFGDRYSDLFVDGDSVFMVTVEGEVVLIHRLTGAARRIAQVVGPVVAAPALSPDRKWLAVCALDGEAFLIDARTGSVESRFSTENEIVAAPLFVGNLLIVAATDSYVYCFDVEQKEPRFIKELPRGIRVTPEVHSGALLVATDDRTVQRLELESKEIAWRSTSLPDSVHSLGVVDDALYVLLKNGGVHVVEATSGDALNVFPPQKGVAGGMAVTREFLYVTHQSGWLVAWDLEQGRVDWTWQAPSAITVPPLVIQSQILVGGASGKAWLLEIIK